MYLYHLLVTQPISLDLGSKDRDIIRFMLSEKLSSSTAAGYKGKGMLEWKKFLRANRMWKDQDLDNDTFVCLQRINDTDKTRVDLLILYIYFLRQGGVNDVSIYCIIEI